MQNVSLMINMPEMVGYNNDTQAYHVLSKQLAEEFHSVFFRRISPLYDNEVQTAQILALALPDVVPNDVRNLVMNYLVSDITRKKNHASTDIIGTAQLLTHFCRTVDIMI
jgi:hypothetical protein